MKSLFLRIFLSFWFTMGLIVVTGIALTAFVQWKQFDSGQKIEIGDIADGANGILQTQGFDGLRTWLERSQEGDESSSTGVRMFVIDMHGQDILGRTLSERIERRVKRMKTQGYLADEQGNPPPLMLDPVRMSPQIVGPDGKVYTMFVDFRRFSFNQVFAPSTINISILIIALGVSALACVWLARYLSRPVTILQANVRALATGNLDARVGTDIVNRQDELGVLAREFDQMAERLRTLLASKEALLRYVSHELRSPLARLRVALSLARREGADQPREFERMERETERLDALIGQILRFSRLEGNDASLTPHAVDLTQLLAEVVEDARLEARTTDKSVTWEPLTTSVMVMGNQDGLRSAIDNIMRNALRFTADRSQVEVSLQLTASNATISVRDHGSGVPATDLERIFEPFYRVESSERQSGSGLGLAIAARVTSLHGGKISARNADDGGLIIELTLPLLA